LNHTDFWFAARVITPVPKVAVSSATAALMWKNGAWDFWARGSFMRRVLGAGFTYRQDKN